MARKMNVYYAAARDLTDGTLADCKIVASNYDIAEKKAIKEFNSRLNYYEFEVNEQEVNEEEAKDLKAGVYDDAPYGYAYRVFC